MPEIAAARPATAVLAPPVGGAESLSLPLMSFSTQVKVTPPSLLLSLNLNRKVPGGLVLKMARSLSLLSEAHYIPGDREGNSKVRAEDLWYAASLLAE